MLVGHMASSLMRLYDPHYGDNQPNRSNVFDMPLVKPKQRWRRWRTEDEDRWNNNNKFIGFLYY